MTNEDIIKLVREVADKDKVDPVHNDMVTLTIEELGKLLAAEREACAKVLDAMAENDKLSNYYRVAALAIRERGAP